MFDLHPMIGYGAEFLVIFLAGFSWSLGCWCFQRLVNRT
jgi:hypothetical protein